jgi:hypothetical protein
MINSFQRNLVQVELKKRIDLWESPSFRSQFFGNLPVNTNLPTFTTERDESGHYYISDNLVAYCNITNGLIFRMRKVWNVQDWDCYTELYNKGVETGKFRIDIPLYKEVIDTKGAAWEYAELQSPGNNYGQNFNDDVFQWPELTNGTTPNTGITAEFKDQVTEYFKTFVDQALEITHEARLISEKNNCGMPLDLCYIFNRYKDDNGYFWSDFDQAGWNNTRQTVIEDSLTKLQSAVFFGKICGVLDDSRIEEIFSYAREKWQAI